MSLLIGASQHCCMHRVIVCSAQHTCDQGGTSGSLCSVLCLLLSTVHCTLRTWMRLILCAWMPLILCLFWRLLYMQSGCSADFLSYIIWHCSVVQCQGGVTALKAPTVVSVDGPTLARDRQCSWSGFLAVLACVNFHFACQVAAHTVQPWHQC